MIYISSASAAPLSGHHPALQGGQDRVEYQATAARDLGRDIGRVAQGVSGKRRRGSRTVKIACLYRPRSESQGDDPALPFPGSQVPREALQLCALPHQG